MKNILLVIFVFFSGLLGAAPSFKKFEFTFVENLEPYETFPCTHQKASVGLFEWDVECAVREKRIKYWVHLAVSQYPETSFGKNAYEVLYWVTSPDSTTHRHSSTSLWIHNSEEKNRINRLAASLGIDEDNASLRLTFSY